VKFLLHELSTGVLCCFLTTTTLAANWSNTSLAASYGRDFSEHFKNDAQGNAIDIEKYIFSLVHLSGYTYGTNFFQLNMHQSSNEPNTNKASGHGAQEAYVIYRHTLDIPSITQHKIEDSAWLKSYGFTVGFDWNTKNDDYGSNRQMYVAGPSITLNVPGYLNLSLLGYYESNDANVLTSKYTYDPYLALQVLWDFPVMQSNWNYQGIGVWMSPKGKNETGGKTASEIFVDMSLMYSLLKDKSVHQPKLKAGVAYQYWKNKYGNNESGEAGRGATASSPMLRLAYRF